MRSLSAHLRRPEDHARLSFHPDCPTCRGERLVGVLPQEAFVSRRTQAAIAAGVLAFSTGAAPVAVAAGQQPTGDGTVATGQAGDGDWADDPDLDPGGDSPDLPEEPPSPLEPPADPVGDEPPVEEDPVADPELPEGPGDDAGMPDDTDPPETGEDEAEAGDEMPATTPVGGVEPGDAEVAEPQGDSQTGPKADGGAARRAPDAAKPAAPPAAATVTPATASPTTTVVPVQAPATTVRVVSGADSGKALPGDRFHVVRGGESLWSIATDRLGDSATPASVARAVNGLWELNRDRIGTGNPDLLLVGTQLRLR